jgi:hypothetical protein
VPPRQETRLGTSTRQSRCPVENVNTTPVTHTYTNSDQYCSRHALLGCYTHDLGNNGVANAEQGQERSNGPASLIVDGAVLQQPRVIEVQLRIEMHLRRHSTPQRVGVASTATRVITAVTT